MSHSNRDCRSEGLRVSAQVNKTGNHTCRIIGMEGRKDEVSRERGLERDFRDFRIPDLPHHDHVRILAEHGTQSRSKGIVFAVGLRLHNTRKVVFDRILDGHDLYLRRMYLLKEGVDSSCLPRTCGTGREEHAGRTTYLALELLQKLRMYAHIGEGVLYRRGIKEAEHNRLTIIAWNS